MHGIPLSFGRFEWPFDESSSGADTSLVHGEARLEDGGESVRHAKIAASMTVTFRDVGAAPQQPFAEGFVYNAVRKTMDQGQLELVKSRQPAPAPLTTRSTARSRRHSASTTPARSKGGDSWQGRSTGYRARWAVARRCGADPRDAQYLNTTVEELRKAVGALAVEGVLRATDAEYGAATAKLMERREEYVAQLERMLAFIRPSFNEEMRHGLTNR